MMMAPISRAEPKRGDADGGSARSAFTLVELVIALSITVFVVVILVGLLSQGMTTAGESRADSTAVFIADSVRTKLLVDPAWPSGTESRALREGESFSMDLFFTVEGTQVDDQEQAFYRAVLTFMRSPNYSSARLDYVALEIKRKDRDDTLSTFTFHRSRQTPRPEI